MEIINRNCAELHELCRLCLSNANDMITLFDEKTQDLPSRIFQCVSIRVSPEDGLPRNICGSCRDYIAGWTTFKEECQRKNRILHKHVKQTKSSERRCTEFDQGCNFLPAADKINHNVNSAANVEHGSLADREKVAKHQTNTETEYEKHCEKCGHSWKEKSIYTYHLCDLGLGSGHRFVCNICEKDYSTTGAVKTHLQMHKGKHRCSACGKCFPSRFQVEVHARVHTREKPLVCEYCGHSFAHNRGLFLHITTAHTVPSKAQLYSCPQCDYRTPSRSYLESHTAVHAARKPYVCEICGRGYTLISSLTTHQANHSDVKSFECGTCNKMFQTRRKLASHIVVHNTVRPFHCEDCGKRFTRKEGLREHRVIHTGEKRYNCLKCKKSFAWRKILRTHKCALDAVDSTTTATM